MSNAYSGSYANIGRLPLGVALLAILIGIFGAFVLLAGVLLLVFGTGLALASGGTVLGFGGAVGGLLLLVLGVIILAVAAGLWDQELWALALAIIVLIVYAVIEAVAAAWLGFLIVGVLLVYLVAVSNHFD